MSGEINNIFYFSLDIFSRLLYMVACCARDYASRKIMSLTADFEKYILVHVILGNEA